MASEEVSSSDVRVRREGPESLIQFDKGGGLRLLVQDQLEHFIYVRHTDQSIKIASTRITEDVLGKRSMVVQCARELMQSVANTRSNEMIVGYKVCVRKRERMGGVLAAIEGASSNRNGSFPSPLVRIPSAGGVGAGGDGLSWQVKYALDAGARGVIAPMVSHIFRLVPVSPSNNAFDY